MRQAAPTANVRHRGALPHGLGQLARVAVVTHGSEKLGGRSGAQVVLRHWIEDARHSGGC